MWQRTDAGTNFINDKYCRLSQCAPMSAKSDRIQVVCFRWHLTTNIEINIDCICWIKLLSNYSNLRYVLKRLCLIIIKLFKYWYNLADCKDGGLAPSKDHRFGEKSEVANMSRQVEYVVLSRIIKERVLNKTLQPFACVRTWLQIGCVRGTWQVAVEKKHNGLSVRNCMERCLCSIKLTPLYQPKLGTS